ncbi:MAG: hypothetical protein ACREQV_10020 [Candidatus Binatia bacterium]
MATKQDVFQEHLEEYLKVNRARKGEILTHVCFVTQLHRKSAIRKFKRLQVAGPAPPKRRGRTTRYGPAVTAALRTVWEAGSEGCGELLHPMINEYVDILKRDGMWEHAVAATQLLRQMSEATVKRRLRQFLKARKRRKGISATKPSHLKKLVPVFTGPWHDKPPGFGQIDSVRHSNSASGDAVCTINYIDAATFLVVPRAQFNLGQRATQASMAAIQQTLPFSWLGAHPDSGSEYLNHFVKDWCDEQTIELTRSRPNRKNDNMFVEERNGHVVRKYVGYMRLDCPEAADALNELYDVLYPYLLHFVAVRRQVKRVKVKSKYVRQYEKTAKTPYQRILDHSDVKQAVKDTLTQEHQRLNPLVLKREIDRLTKKVYDTQQRYGNYTRRE